MLKNNNWF